MKLIVARSRTVVVGNGEVRGPGEEVEIFGKEIERFIRLGFVHKPGEAQSIAGYGSGPSANMDHTVGLQPQPKGFKFLT